MPCKECSEGNYKWGETGECEYATLQDCEDANSTYEEMKTTSIVELVIDGNEELAIDAISLVSAPAIEQDFVFFGKEKNNLTFAKVDEDKRMLISPALIPDKQIFRHDPQTQSDYYVFFSKDTVRQASELYLKNNNHHKATQEHTERVSGVLTVESWIIDDPKMDKSTLYGFSLPKGTWMVSMRITNDEIWKEIKSGTLKGLSIEGYFTDKMEKMSETTPTDQEILEALNEMLKGKTELKAEKIELGLVDDLDKLVAKSNTISKELTKDVSDYEKQDNILQKVYRNRIKVEEEFKKLKQEEEVEGRRASVYYDAMQDVIQKARDIRQKIEKDLSTLKKSAKELGVDIPLGKYENAIEESKKATGKAVSADPLPF